MHKSIFAAAFAVSVVASAPAHAFDPMTALVISAGAGMANNMMRMQMQHRQPMCPRPYIAEHGRCVPPHYRHSGRYIGAPMRYAAPYRSGAGAYYGRSETRSGYYGQQDQDDDRSESKHVTDPRVMEAHQRPVSMVCGGRHSRVRVPVENGGIANFDCP